MEQKVFPGYKCGQLTVIDVYPANTGTFKCKCKCEICGNIIEVNQGRLCGTKKIKSCGCAKNIKIENSSYMVKLLQMKNILDKRTQEDRKRIIEERKNRKLNK